MCFGNYISCFIRRKQIKLWNSFMNFALCWLEVYQNKNKCNKQNTKLASSVAVCRTRFYWFDCCNAIIVVTRVICVATTKFCWRSYFLLDGANLSVASSIVKLQIPDCFKRCAADNPASPAPIMTTAGSALQGSTMLSVMVHTSNLDESSATS